jgi:oligoendopeptidase F
MLRGVPNTAFTEAVAFLFQANDLKLLGQGNPSNIEEAEALAALDNCWSAYEIMGVSLLDMYVWQWMYENPDCNPKELQQAVERIAIEVWNNYYYPIFGVKDSPILAIYSHMITSPLYLANYPVGHLIEFQIEQYVKDKQFADEITRMLVQGQIIPQEWMKGAVGTEISGKPTLEAVNQALKIVK